MKILRFVLCSVLCVVFAACDRANAEAPAAAHAAREYSNPVINIVGPADPTVIRVDGVYYLYPTWDEKGFDVFTSTDLVHWERRGRAFEAPTGGAWAPDVFHNTRGDGRFYMYYSAKGPAPAMRVGVAVADNPMGPFEDKGFLFDYDAIDPHLFQDADGAMYLYHADRRGSCIAVQPMETPLKKKGKSKPVICPKKPWERMVTEGPWMMKRNDIYYLMYSGNFANGPDYAVGYATSKSPAGPFVKYEGNPIAARNTEALGPGHHCVVEGPRGDLWMVYHQKTDEKMSWDRDIAIDPLWFDDKGVIHTRVTRGTPHPAP